MTITLPIEDPEPTEGVEQDALAIANGPADIESLLSDYAAFRQQVAAELVDLLNGCILSFP